MYMYTSRIYVNLNLCSNLLCVHVRTGTCILVHHVGIHVRTVAPTGMHSSYVHVPCTRTRSTCTCTCNSIISYGRS